MTMLLETTRPYQRLDAFDKTVVDRQIKAFLSHIRRKPYKTQSAPSACVQNGNGAKATQKTVEPETDFIPPTDTQKRTRRSPS